MEPTAARVTRKAMKTNMEIVFRCESCRKTLGAPASRAGDTAKCPGCGKTVRVPSTSK